jgi:YD repeat-containing protein
MPVIVFATSTLNYTTPSSVPYGLIQIVLRAPNNQVNFDNVRLRSTNIATKPAESYAYDANGNRLTSSWVSTSADGTHNRQQSDGTHNFTYDNEGNRISRTQISNGYFTQYVWDYRNRLTQVVERSSAASATPLKNV